jgi:hypothetical protein
MFEKLPWIVALRLPPRRRSEVELLEKHSRAKRSLFFGYGWRTAAPSPWRSGPYLCLRPSFLARDGTRAPPALPLEDSIFIETSCWQGGGARSGCKPDEGGGVIC